jgi:glucosylceramidase
MGPLQNWASGVAAWTLGTTAQDGPHLSEGGCATCTGLVTINNGAFTFQTAYYMMAQFSKFIPVGATIVSGTGSYTYSDGTGVQAVASVNPDGTRTVVIENNLTSDIYIHLTTQSGQEWSGNVPVESVTTWVLPAV